MKTSLTLGIAILMMAVGAPATSCAATLYDITLLDSNGSTVDATGSFTYDGSTFDAFMVTWDTLTFDITSVADSTPTQTYGCDGNASISFFTYMTTPDCESENSVGDHAWVAGNITGNRILFAFSEFENPVEVTLNGQTTQSDQTGPMEVEVATPEPSLFLFVSTALLTLASRARKRKLHHQGAAHRTITVACS
jgi:hypothetical protein